MAVMPRPVSQETWNLRPGVFRPMWMVFFILALIWVCMLLFHITLELNTLDKNVAKLADALKKHYGR